MAGEFFKVDCVRNEVIVFGDLRLNSLSSLTAALHNMVVKAGYRDIIINFTSLSSMTLSVVPALSAFLRSLVRNHNVDFVLEEPRDQGLKSRIIRYGLGHYICHRSYPKPRKNSSDASVLQFLDHDEREFAVDKVINSALRVANLDRQHVAALDWAVNEITDNVLTHSQSKVGGFLICGKVAGKNIIEFTVADAGIGVARSLGEKDECLAVERAIQEGVTRNKTTNQGNGLFGTYRLALASAGIFALKSRHGNLYVTKEGDMHVRNDLIPYNGTLVVCQIDCDRPDLIERAFQFGGRSHIPAFDYIERKHESTDQTTVAARDICKTFGSRQSGSEARRYISNVLSSAQGGQITIDFVDVNVISSSYADEVFGKLFVELGPMRFMAAIKIVNAPSAVVGLIDRAITLRTQTGL